MFSPFSISPGGAGAQGPQGPPGDPATNLVTSVAGKQGVVTLVKGDVGLGSVDNTSDNNKPVSTAQAAADAAVAAAAQPIDADLTAIAALASTADRVPYATGAGTWALATLVAAGRSLIAAVDAAAQRVVLGLGTLATQSGTFSGTSSGTNTGDQVVSDASLSTSDITTNDLSITKHGFAPKAPNDTAKFLRGDAVWGAPTASVVDPNPQSYSPGSFTLATEKYVIMSRHLKLTGAQRVTLQGTSTLRVT